MVSVDTCIEMRARDRDWGVDRFGHDKAPRGDVRSALYPRMC
jgi:hypothetical protein